MPHLSQCQTCLVLAVWDGTDEGTLASVRQGIDLMADDRSDRTLLAAFLETGDRLEDAA